MGMYPVADHFQQPETSSQPHLSEEDDDMRGLTEKLYFLKMYIQLFSGLRKYLNSWGIYFSLRNQMMWIFKWVKALKKWKIEIENTIEIFPSNSFTCKNQTEPDKSVNG